MRLLPRLWGNKSPLRNLNGRFGIVAVKIRNNNDISENLDTDTWCFIDQALHTYIWYCRPTRYTKMSVNISVYYWKSYTVNNVIRKTLKLTLTNEHQPVVNKSLFKVMCSSFAANSPSALACGLTAELWFINIFHFHSVDLHWPWLEGNRRGVICNVSDYLNNEYLWA